jgi:two-component system cell cycle response regulator
MSPARVLVVDDSALARAVVVRHLAREGYEVLEAGSGEEALEVCELDPPDVVLLDVEMPGIGGHETLRRIVAHPVLGDMPVLFLTGLTDPADLAEGLRLGAHDYVRKPFEAVELQARVRTAVRTSALQEALRERNADLERLASSDGLTGLSNRRFLEEQAARAVSRLKRHGGSMGVVILDVDAFKAVNDTFGHAAGDQVLVTVARRLGAAVRTEDLLGRWGGEEFVVLAADTQGEGVARLAERLRAAVAATPVPVGDREHVVTISAGWAAGHGGVPFAALVRAADDALYAAKAEGRDRVRGAVLDAT